MNIEIKSGSQAPLRMAQTVFRSQRFHKLQLRHFFLFDALPLLTTVAAFALIPWLPPHPLDLAMFGCLWLVTGLGLTVGFHRYFAHGAFSAERGVSLGLLIAGSMAARGPMISWVAMHRRHHERSDRAGDLHSPQLNGSSFRGKVHGLLHAHLTWMLQHDYPNVMHYVPDLMARKDVVRVNRLYYYWVVLGLALPTFIGAVATLSLTGALTGFLWGGAVRVFAVEHAMSAVNSLCHAFGSRPFKTRDDHSANIAILAPVTWGEAWHNNHHAFPNSAAFGLSWYQLDPGFCCIWILEKLGLVSEVKRPSPRLILQRRATADSI